MIARSSSLAGAGGRWTEERLTVIKPHCRVTESAGSCRSISANPSARLICRAFVQKIIFDLELTNLPIQQINLRLAGRTLHRCATALENTRRAVQQLLLPVVDLVRMNPKGARQLGHRPVTLDRRQRHLRLKRRPVLLACLLHVLLLRHRRFLGAGLHLSQVSHFRGPAHSTVADRGGEGWKPIASTASAALTGSCCDRARTPRPA